MGVLGFNSIFLWVGVKEMRPPSNMVAYKRISVHWAL